MLNRRELLARSAIAATASAMPAPLLAEAAKEAAQGAGKPDWTLGLTDVQGDIAPQALTRLHGSAPELSGTLYRNGPACFRRGASAVSHWFDGDGLVRAWRIEGGKARLAARFVDTPKRRLEDSLGRIVQPGFGTPSASGSVLAGPDDTNAANTNVIAAGGKLLALWEAGSPFALDPETLATKGPVTFQPDLAGMPFLAHPRVEPSGQIWNLGIGGEMAFVWRLSADGMLEAGETVRLPMASYIHDFTATERHLIILCQPWVYDELRMPVMNSYAWKPELGSRVLVIDKDDLSQRREYELPPLFFFHVGDAWEDKSGTIRFDACLHNDPGFALQGASALVDGQMPVDERPELSLITLHSDGRAELSRTGTLAEFPRSAPDLAGLPRRHTVHVGGYRPGRPFARTIGVWDWQREQGEEFDFGAQQLVEEFVPVGQYLIGTTLNLAAKASELHVLDARRVGDGPVVSWRSEMALPLTFHGNWVA